MGAQAPYEGREVGDEAGKSVHSAQAKSSVSARISGQDQDDASRERTAGSPPATGKDDTKTATRSALVPDKRPRKGLPRERKLLAPRQ